ncbi:MAG TPA: MGMT family protein, partial [Pyrinomonadaceae bacterium]|nr:MGMT family protein [Pyrinomonadaceae bacterium]
MDKKHSSEETANSPGGQPVNVESPRYRERVYELVRRIPPGRVMTYGQLAELLGEGYTARTVG